MLIETFEARQMFSVTAVDAVAPAPDASTEQPAFVVDADAAAKKKGTGTGKAIPGSISFTHSYDIASPVITG